MWTAVSGAAAKAHAVDVVANNLANQDTNGFKKDLPAFKEYLSSVERDHDRGAIHTGPVKDKDLNPLYDKDQSHVVVEGTYSNFKQGPIKITKNPLDIAIEGPGLIEVSTPGGSRFTRLGSFKLSQEGKLVTQEGYPVLLSRPGGLAATQEIDPNNKVIPGSIDDPATISRHISLRDRGNVSITEEGEIYSEADLIGKIALVEFSNPNYLQKVGLQQFENKNPQLNSLITPTKTKIHQGMLEGSNVNPVEEITNLIKANRLYELDMKSLKTYSDILGKEANDLGRL